MATGSFHNHADTGYAFSAAFVRWTRVNSVLFL